MAKRYHIGQVLCATGLLSALSVCRADSGASGPVCKTCHPGETARYQTSAMANSVAKPAPLPDGRVDHAASESVMAAEYRGDRMTHSLSERGLTAAYPVKYQIGGRLIGRTYMVQIGSFLFESPLSWFNAYGWDISPGYAHQTLIDFDRPIEEQCLFCHTGSTRFADKDGRRLTGTDLKPITCERCHGSAEQHVRRPSSKNIINPAKLSGPTRNSICEQCHLEGATRVLNNGKNWSDFQVGSLTESTFVTYLLTGGSAANVKAVTHFEQLAQSKCALGSNGKLWCGTCHDPHGTVQDRPHQIRVICVSCHPTLSAAAHSAAPSECTSCHMPRSATTDIAHAAITDHRILRVSSDAPAKPQPLTETVKAWREPRPEVRTRDLGVAKVVIGFSKHLPAIGDEGLRVLDQIPQQLRDRDATVLSDFEGALLQRGDLSAALQFGRGVVSLQPESAKAVMNYAMVLSRSGDSAEAERQFKRAIELDPSLKQAYMELARLYDNEQNFGEASSTLDLYLKWNPQDILFRLQKARLSGPP